MNDKIDIAIVEDHLLQRRALVQILGSIEDFEVTYSGETLDGFVSHVRSLPEGRYPRVLVLDLVVDRGKDADPSSVQWLIKSGIDVLVVSAMAYPAIVRAMLKVGVAGVMGKRDSPATIIKALRAVAKGESWMTPEAANVIAGDMDIPNLSAQERRALILYASGLTMDEVAKAIGVQPNTAKKYLDRVKTKYSAVGRTVRTKVDMLQAVQHDGFDTSEAERVHHGNSKSR